MLEGGGGRSRIAADIPETRKQAGRQARRCRKVLYIRLACGKIEKTYNGNPGTLSKASSPASSLFQDVASPFETLFYLASPFTRVLQARVLSSPRAVMMSQRYQSESRASLKALRKSSIVGRVVRSFRVCGRMRRLGLIT